MAVNRSSRRRMSAVALALAGVALLTAACASAKTTISYSTWGNGEEIAVDKALIAAFEKANPSIKVSLNAFWNYEPKLLVMIAAGAAPDVMSIGRTWLPDFLMAVRPIPLLGVDKDAYIAPSLLTALSYKGKQMGLPKRMNTKVMLYDKSAFDQGGLAVPIPGWAPIDFDEAARKLTVRSDNKVQRWGSGPIVMWNWVTAFGAAFFNDEVTKAQFTSPEMIAAAKFMAGLHRRYAGWFADFGVFDQALATGKMAMFADLGPWYIANLLKAKALDWRVTETPGKPIGVELVGLSIAKNTKHFREALAFATFVSNSPEAQAIVATGANLPVTKAATKVFVQRAPTKELSAFTDVLKRYNFPPMVPTLVNFGGFWATVETTFYQKIMVGKVDPIQGLEGLQKTGQSIVDSRRRK